MDLVVGNLTAKEGEKVQGFFEIQNTNIKAPCTLINGEKSGKTVVITAGTHGGEYPGIEAAIRLATELTPKDLHGCLIIMHPYNIPAFEAKLQYLNPIDGKNLNREFPGSATGTVTQKMAYAATTELHGQADFYMDLHGGDIHEDLMPFVIYPTIGSEEVTRISREAASCMGIEFITPSSSENGTFGSAAIRGVPGFLSEIGGSGLWSEKEVGDYMNGVRNVLKYLGVLAGEVEKLSEVTYLKKTHGLDATADGCWYPAISQGTWVKKDQKVGEIKDFFGKKLADYFSPSDGVVFYVASSLAINQNNPLVAIGEKEEN